MYRYSSYENKFSFQSTSPIRQRWIDDGFKAERIVAPSFISRPLDIAIAFCNASQCLFRACSPVCRQFTHARVMLRLRECSRSTIFYFWSVTLDAKICRTLSTRDCECTDVLFSYCASENVIFVVWLVPLRISIIKLTRERWMTCWDRIIALCPVF